MRTSHAEARIQGAVGGRVRRGKKEGEDGIEFHCATILRDGEEDTAAERGQGG